MFSKRQIRRRKRRADGAAAVELAVVLPLIMLIVFGAIQTCNAIHLKQALVTSVFEGTRIVSRRTATRDLAITRMEQILDARGVQGYQITITPAAELVNIDDGTLITVTVTAPSVQNIGGPNFVDFGLQISASGVAAR